MKKLNLFEWLGFERYPNFRKSKPLGGFFGFAILLVMLALTAIFFVTLVDLFLALFGVGKYQNDTDGSAIRNVGLVLAALLGAPFIVWRTIATERQTNLAEESLYNDKINAASHDLSARIEVFRLLENGPASEYVKFWEDDVVTRSAAIDRLEGLALERPNLALRIAKLLAIYVRGTFPAKDLNFTEPPFKMREPRLDLQRAVDSLGKINSIARRQDESKWRLDLRNCDFDGVDFKGGDFFATDFSASRFELADLSEANLTGALFVGALLNFAFFRGALLVGSKLDRCILNRPVPFPGGMTFSINLARIKGVSFAKADISALDYLGEPETIALTFGTEDTLVSHELSHYMLPLEERRLAIGYLRRSKSQPLTENQSELAAKFEATGFHFWSPYTAADLGTGHMRAEFYRKLGMNEWPFI